LLLEDQDIQSKLGVLVLKACGAREVLTAFNGADALELLAHRSEPFQIILCDLRMPDMDGLEFLRHIAVQGVKSSVILVSGVDASIIRAAELMARSYGLNILGAIEKPISQNKLWPLVLRSVIQSQSAPLPRNQLMAAAEIRLGIQRGEFIPYFQPQVSMRTGDLVGVEALMRWLHPQHGIIGPDRFIPVMEAEGLIDAATEDILDESLAQMKRWHGDGLDVAVSVNISVEILRDTNLPERLRAKVVAAGIEPAMLTFEITETTAMTDHGHSLETLARLRMEGFGLSLDDYGTGFSSMKQLSEIPFSELKIDQIFVSGSGQRPILGALVETSAALARRLNLRCVAEGIENSDDWDSAARYGCSIAQGFFVAKPMPGAQILDWHRGWAKQHPRISGLDRS
jgi:EAL domain-containing protein (putative c-di-GMP-specific phosphodiesterase class I)/FixJ family two-component response regulator